MTGAAATIAGIRVVVRGARPATLAAFWGGEADGADLRVDVRTRSELRPAPDAAPGVRMARDGTRFTYAGVGSRGFIDLARGEARFDTFRESEHIDGFLRFAVGLLLLERGGLLLHAAGVARGGRGWALLGPSGAGKTTAASLAEASGATVLGDEIVAVRTDGARARLWGTPFGSRGRRAGAPGSAPLAALCLLEQAKAHAFRPIARPAMARLLLRHAVLAPETSDPARLLDVALDLASRAPAGVLAFRMDSSFLDVLPS